MFLCGWGLVWPFSFFSPLTLVRISLLFASCWWNSVTAEPSSWVGSCQDRSSPAVFSVGHGLWETLVLLLELWWITLSMSSGTLEEFLLDIMVQYFWAIWDTYLLWLVPNCSLGSLHWSMFSPAMDKVSFLPTSLPVVSVIQISNFCQPTRT